MSEIRLEKVEKRFADFVAVRDSSFVIHDREFFVLLGPSGCGKTTTLRMIAGLEFPSSGTISIDNEDVTSKGADERDIGFVFQLFALYPHMNVRQNIGFPLRCQGVPRADIARRVDEVARLLGIEALLDRRVAGLSGGDSQRVSLGRAIVRDAKAFMMDEPLGALDAEMRERMCGELRRLHDRIGATTVYVTHDQVEAMAMADRIAVMNHGVVDQIGSPMDVYDHPATLHVAGFIGSPAMNLLPVSAALAAGQRELELGGMRLPIPLQTDALSERALVIGVRPEHVELVGEGGLRGQVFGSEYLGTVQIITVNTPHGQVKVRADSALAVTPDAPIGLQFRADRTHLFDATSGATLGAARTGADSSSSSARVASGTRGLHIAPSVAHG